MNHEPFEHPKFKSLFLAIELDPESKQKLAQTLYLDFPKSHIRRQSPRDFHITLGFIPHVKWEDRAAVIESFKPLQHHGVLNITVTDVVALGNYGQILCARFGPQEELENLANTANQLLQDHTDYKFDTSYSSYIPHVKIQTMKAKAPNKDLILEAFRSTPFKTIRFKTHSLALMERIKYHYAVVKRYKLMG